MEILKEFSYKKLADKAHSPWTTDHGHPARTRQGLQAVHECAGVVFTLTLQDY